MQAFTYTSLPSRVVFGKGKLAALAEETRLLGLSRVLVLCTPGQAALGENIAQLLGPLSAGVYAKAVMHVPEEVALAAVEHANDLKVDGLVAVGGGSAIGLGKAMALNTGLPMLAVPTTYSGSEMTTIWGLTSNGVKTTGRDNRVRPRTVLYDPDLSAKLPAGLAATSGMNAMAHCVEALYASDANPISTMMAEAGIHALGQALPAIVERPDDGEARSQALYGAWLAGTVLGMVSMSLHHKICHTLGGSFNLPHAEVHTVMVAYVTAFNRTAAPEAMARIAGALETGDAATGLYDLVTRLQAPLSLRAIGMQEQDLDKAARLATSNPYFNPRAVTLENVRELLQSAYEGQRPE